MTGERSVTLIQHGIEIAVAVIDPSTAPERALRTYQPSPTIAGIVRRALLRIVRNHVERVEMYKGMGTAMVLSFTCPPRGGFHAAPKTS